MELKNLVELPWISYHNKRNTEVQVVYISSKQKKLSEIFSALRLSLRKTSLFNFISQFEVRAVVLCYREELPSGCAIMSSSFIFSFLSNQEEDVYTKGLCVPSIHDSVLLKDCVGWREKSSLF